MFCSVIVILYLTNECNQLETLKRLPVTSGDICYSFVNDGSFRAVFKFLAVFCCNVLWIN